MMCLLTLNTQLRVRVNGAMFVFGHTLIHPRILQGEVSDPQSAIIHFHAVLRADKCKIQILLQLPTGNVPAEISAHAPLTPAEGLRDFSSPSLTFFQLHR